MSARKISLARGVVITCDGCGEKLTTACIVLKSNRTYARDAHGWIRGGRGVRDRMDRSRDPDLCSKCAPAELARVAELRAEAEAKRKARDERRRITTAPAPIPPAPEPRRKRRGKPKSAEATA